MNRYFLPDDVARCDGVKIENEWRNGCEFCLRRLAKQNNYTNKINPPKIIIFECEYLIES